MLDQFVPGVPVNVILDVPVESASISDGVDALNVGACVFFIVMILLILSSPHFCVSFAICIVKYLNSICDMPGVSGLHQI